MKIKFLFIVIFIGVGFSVLAQNVKAATFFLIGLTQVLNKFQISVFAGPFFAFSFLTPFLYNIAFLVLGFFLMVACFMMEL